MGGLRDGGRVLDLVDGAEESTVSVFGPHLAVPDYDNHGILADRGLEGGNIDRVGELRHAGIHTAAAISIDEGGGGCVDKLFASGGGRAKRVAESVVFSTYCSVDKYQDAVSPAQRGLVRETHCC